MSARNGNKSRYGRERKQKIERRVRMRALRGTGSQPGHPAHSAPPAEQDHPGLMQKTARSIGSALGAVAAKAGLSHAGGSDEQSGR